MKKNLNYSKLKTVLTILILVVIISPHQILAQTCGMATASHINHMHQEINGDPNTIVNVKVYWHVLRDGNNQGDNSIPMLTSIIEEVKGKYASMKINLVNTCGSISNNINIIKDQNLYDLEKDFNGYFCELTDYCFNDGLNVFLVDNTFTGDAYGTGKYGVRGLALQGGG